MSVDKTANRTLSIRISTNGFCFCSYIQTDPSSLKYSYYPTDKDTSLEVNLRRAIDECPFITGEGNLNVKAIIETQEYTAIPAEFDDRKDYKVFYRCCFPKSDSNIEIMSNRLTVQGLTIIFAVDKGIYTILQGLGDVTYYTPASILMGYMTRSGVTEENCMLAYLHGEHSTFIPVRDGRIGVSSSFKAESGEDHLFYMLSIWKEQGFSQSEDALYLCGDSRVEELQMLISRFIKNRKRINPSEQFQSSLLNRIEGIPFDLQALILCE